MPTKTAAKKAAPRSAVKKTVKKAATKRVPKAKQPLVYADHQTSFWVEDGQILNSLLALRDALGTMSKATYQYHISPEHNDFAKWVEVVLCDSACATSLRSAKTPATAKAVVIRHLKAYSY